MDIESLAWVAHADWSKDSRKRWLARAVRQPSGAFRVYPPEPVGDPAILLSRLEDQRAVEGGGLIGFDFPIGLPLAYAQKAEIEDFLAFFRAFARGDWPAFAQVAEHPAQICLERPFYPLRAGSARRQHLLDGLEMETMDDLLRQCERPRPGRRAACSLFWTLGGQQVGKAALHGWGEVLVPAITGQPGRFSSPSTQVSLWPFDGSLESLVGPGTIVIAETYPAEAYTRLGIQFPRSRAAPSGKRVQASRAACAPKLLAWALAAGMQLEPPLHSAILDGYGPSAAGEDQFDAIVGLFGMLDVLLRAQEACEPANERIRHVEGWIFGLETQSLS